MCEESDEEISDLDIELRTWNKLERDMKVIGFQEGTSKGRDIALQEGFNSGYLDGFSVGEYLGMAKGIISCQKALGIPVKGEIKFEEKDITNLSSQVCTLCPKDKKYEVSINEEFLSETFEDIILMQQGHNNEIITALEKANFKLNLKQE